MCAYLISDSAAETISYHFFSAALVRWASESAFEEHEMEIR